jgi:hypothetical protein
LSTAQASAPFLATGRLGERQLRRLDRMLEQTAGAGLFRVVLLHHPPAAHTVRWRKSLLDGAALREVIAKRGAELTLHGHAHFSSATYLDGANGRNLAIGVLGIGDRRQGRSARDLPCIAFSAGEPAGGCGCRWYHATDRGRFVSTMAGACDLAVRGLDLTERRVGRLRA